MRLVADDGIVTVSQVKINNKDEETDHHQTIATEKGWRSLRVIIEFLRFNYSETEDGGLPTSVLLQRIRVGGQKEKERVGRRKGRLVRRRRRRRKNQRQHHGETFGDRKDAVREQAVYFTPL